MLVLAIACPAAVALADARPARTGQPLAPPSRQACASEPLRTTGRIHYVCDCQPGADQGCMPGRDDNNGMSPRSPLRSYSKAAEVFTNMHAGDTVAFCRGGRWKPAAGAGWANDQCRKDRTCDIRDYQPPWGKGSEHSPSIWIDGGPDGATLMTFIHPPRHFEGYRVFNLDLHGGKADVAIFFFNQTTDVDLCNLSSDGFGISVQIAGGDNPQMGVSSNIVLRSSRITNNTNIAYLGVCDGCSVEDNFFDNNGARDVRTHTIYFASQAYETTAGTVVHTARGMRLLRNQIHYSTQPCLGAPVVVHGRHLDVLIEDNLVDAARAGDECWGPGVGCGGYGYGCSFRNTVIRNNVFKDLGNVGSDDSNCTGCLLENNLFIMNRNGTAISLGSNRPRAPVPGPYGQWDGTPDDASDDVVVRNNTIFFGKAATSAAGITVYSGRRQVIVNNAIVFPTSDTANSACYRLEAPPADIIVRADYNLCWMHRGGWAEFPPGRRLSLTEWQKAGFDQHSTRAAPLFRNPPADFAPADGSPLIDAGDSKNSPRDDAVHKPRGERPDIGAYER